MMIILNATQMLLDAHIDLAVDTNRTAWISFKITPQNINDDNAIV